MKRIINSFFLIYGIILIYSITISKGRPPRCGPCVDECSSTNDCKCGIERDACDCCDICTHCDLDSLCGKCEPEKCPNLEENECQCDMGKDQCKCCDICINCPYEYCHLEIPNQCWNETICKPPVDLPEEIALKQHILGQCIHNYESM